MGALVATSPVGKNGQTVIPAPIRRMLKKPHGRRMVGFFIMRGHVEIAPVDVRKPDDSEKELRKLEGLARQRGGVSFRSVAAPNRYLKTL